MLETREPLRSRKQTGAKKRRSLPPGQKLALALLLVAVSGWVVSFIVQANNQAEEEAVAPVVQQVPVEPFSLQEELIPLEQEIIGAIKKPNLTAGVFAVEPSTGRYVNVNGKLMFPAASIIKLPVLVRYLQAVDEQKIDPKTMLTIKPELVGGGSGHLQWRPKGTKISAKETAELMMIISDNTATNMIVDALGGMKVFNDDFQKWGLTQTKINNWLPDLGGTNTTSPYDIAVLLGKVERGELLTEPTKQYMYSVLERVKTRTLLPMGLPPGTRIAHKTGDIGRLVGDGGIIMTKDGKRYIAVVQVTRPFNDRRANLLIRDLSKRLYVGITGDAEGAKSVVIEPVVKAHAGKKKRHRHR